MRKASVFMFFPDRAPGLAHAGSGHRWIELQRALDALERRRFDGRDDGSLVFLPAVQPGHELGPRPGRDELDAIAEDAGRKLADQAATTETIDDDSPAIVGENGGEHRDDRTFVPGLVAHREARQGRCPLVELARKPLLELAQKARPIGSSARSARRRKAKVLERDRAGLANLRSADAENGFAFEQVGQPRQQLLAAMLEREDEPTMVEPGVIPLDVRGRHPQEPAGLENGDERQLAEADAFARSARL